MDNENSTNKEAKACAPEAPQEPDTAETCLAMKDELATKAQRVVDDQETTGEDLAKMQTSDAASESMKQQLIDGADRTNNKPQNDDQ